MVTVTVYTLLIHGAWQDQFSLQEFFYNAPTWAKYYPLEV